MYCENLCVENKPEVILAASHLQEGLELSAAVCEHGHSWSSPQALVWVPDE